VNLALVDLAVGAWEEDVAGDVEQVCGARDIGEVSAGESEIHSGLNLKAME